MDDDLVAGADPVVVALEDSGETWVNGVLVSTGATGRAAQLDAALAHVAASFAPAGGATVRVVVTDSEALTRWEVGADGSVELVDRIPPLTVDDVPPEPEPEPEPVPEPEPEPDPEPEPAPEPAPEPSPGAAAPPQPTQPPAGPPSGGLRPHLLAAGIALLVTLGLLAAAEGWFDGDSRASSAPAPTQVRDLVGPMPVSARPAPVEQVADAVRSVRAATLTSVRADTGRHALSLRLHSTRAAQVLVRLSVGHHRARDRVVRVRVGTTMVRFDHLPAGRVTWRLVVPGEPRVTGAAAVRPAAPRPTAPVLASGPAQAPGSGDVDPATGGAEAPTTGGVVRPPGSGPVDPDDLRLVV